MTHATDIVIVDAVRSPIGRRGGGLSTMHPADLLATVLDALVERVGIAPSEVGRWSGAASARSARSPSTSPGRPGSPPACRWRRRPPRSTRSAGRPSRRRTWRRRWSVPGSSTRPWRAASSR